MTQDLLKKESYGLRQQTHMLRCESGTQLEVGGFLKRMPDCVRGCRMGTRRRLFISRASLGRMERPFMRLVCFVHVFVGNPASELVACFIDNLLAGTSHS